LDGLSSVLGRICLPAAEEFALILRDKLAGYRATNLIAMKAKLEQKLADNKVPVGAHAPPRLVQSIIEQSSWIDDGMVQDMWAGLPSSSCTEDGDDDSNLIFTNLLGDLTKLQARVLNYACEHAGKSVTENGLLYATPSLLMNLDELRSISGEADL